VETELWHGGLGFFGISRRTTNSREHVSYWIIRELTPNLALKPRFFNPIINTGSHYRRLMFKITELYEYASRVRRSFVEKLSELPPETLTKNSEASFYTMKNIMLHMIDNEDWIVNWVIPGKSQAYVRKKWEEYVDMAAVLNHLNAVENGTRSYLKGMTEESFRKRVNFVLSSGKAFDLSVEECLFQSFTEQLYHLGELIALLWQENIEPPKMQWFWNNPRTIG